ncbi:MAG: prephenate dehydratase [Rhodospirillaceae bacterium]|jgi:prephenate dehydratase|nr:prephenate dehydratase [Rhodospirillaceae bacterium]MBT5239129.1 prephenate dehydratase [Rhodospirillaceae bacterium]MBT5564860.1 prephenate dehydratase [Rhodospirillaceae bacterium]MBT6089176.1 prephenate dehydratase [Rhodospirillaceae bacterium]MBT6960702.1 prephenate dehydratase [Rhodospirillaceae bacterium]
MTTTSDPKKSIAFQGVLGANSHMSCQAAYPDMPPLPCATFDEAFAAVTNGHALFGMIPVENSVMGRIADIHHILPDSGLHIVAEHFQRVNHHLLAIKGATLDGLKTVESQLPALSQCRTFIREHGLQQVTAGDTAGAAKDVAERGDPTVAAIASSLAAEIYGLETLASNIEDAEHNTTRFIVMAREPVMPPKDNGTVVTSFVFRVRSVPAALYKALGGFATNSVNITKLESYLVDGHFTAAQFYADVEGHPEDGPVKLALEELAFYSKELKVLGTYPAHPYRLESASPEES